MPPAARLFDSATCPSTEPPAAIKALCALAPAATPHVGGPIIGKGSSDVFINAIPAARCGDKTLCKVVGELDIIVTGPEQVNINGRLAAMVGSLVRHKPRVSTGSPNVNYGGAMAGAKFGDATAATAACEKAAKGRAKGQHQGKPMNCGHESVRQLCLQRCAQEGRLSKACRTCEACERKAKNRNANAADESTKTTEENVWYENYLRDPDIAGSDNAVTLDDWRAANDRRWREIHGSPGVYQPGTMDRVHDDKLGGSWHDHVGESYSLGSADPKAPRKVVTINEPPTLIGQDENEADKGTIGSTPETRSTMLKDWCGIHDERHGANTMDGIGEDVADGNTVIATVDVNKLPRDDGAKSGSEVVRHAVTVSQMEFNADGSMKEVIVNDTSSEKGCGRHLPGDMFENALVPDAGATNVVPPGSRAMVAEP